MGELGSDENSGLTKMLNIGASGAGKTGALVSLVKAGYRLILYDFDNGHQILLDTSLLPKDLRKNVLVTRYEDKVRSTPSGPLFLNPPAAWMNFLRDLDKHPDAGPCSGFGPMDVVVLDSLTFCGNSILRFMQSLAGTLNKQPPWKEFGPAMKAQEDLLAILYSNAVPCNVVVNAHISYIGDDGDAGGVLANLLQMHNKAEDSETDLAPELQAALVAMSTNVRPTQGYPSALGNKLPPKVGRYFNTMVRTKSIGQGGAVRRIICTKSEDAIELKVPCPGRIAQTLPIESGLATIFKAIKGE